MNSIRQNIKYFYLNFFLYRSFIDENNTTNSSISGESPSDDIESHDPHEALLNIPDGGLTSFVKRSILDNDYIEKSKSSNTDKVNVKKGNFSNEK
jgi:hypothetical protein